MKNSKPFTKEEFLDIYKKVPRIGVELVVLTPQGIIWTRRTISPYKGMWHLPGATLLLNESLDECAYRVAKEELGIEIKLLGHISTEEYLEEDGDRHAVGLVFDAVALDSTKIKLNEDADKYLKTFDFPEGEIIPQHLNLVKKYLE